MGKVRGFLEIRRMANPRRPVAERVRDWHELELDMPEPDLRDQAARCMDCGIPYCHDGCPLANLVPEWNDLVYAGRFAEAARSLAATNNFPEITGRVCPAPCEASCVLNLDKQPVTIKLIERSIAERAWNEGWVRPQRAPFATGRRVVVVGSGPAGLAAAQELARRGHAVTVLEKNDRPGGLLRYGIPDFKLEKAVLDRRLAQLEAEGVVFRCGVHAGVDPTGAELRAGYDAIVLAGGAERPRDLEVPGRELDGVHFAMDYLTQSNRRGAGLAVEESPILATGKRVVVLGGGDTGSDCVGTAHRQGAASVLSLELMPRPPDERASANPWPAWPLIYRSSSSHDEGGTRDFGVRTTRLVADGAPPSATPPAGQSPAGPPGRVVALEAVRADTGATMTIPCDLVLLAMGFLGPRTDDIVAQLGCALDRRGNVATQAGATTVPGVYAAGDMARGQSLVVWAIAEGRRVAARVHAELSAQSRELTADS
jgi:glutamate synthase (NADPH/NADH) small chain